jgi:hypothetical protein
MWLCHVKWKQRSRWSIIIKFGIKAIEPRPTSDIVTAVTEERNGTGEHGLEFCCAGSSRVAGFNESFYR